MVQRGGPWRLARYAIPDGRPARGPVVAGEDTAHEGDRVLRWIVVACVFAVIGGGLVALVGLSEGWWWKTGLAAAAPGATTVGARWPCGTHRADCPQSRRGGIPPRPSGG